MVTPSPYTVPKSIPSAGQQHFHRQEVEAVLASLSSWFVYVSMHVRRQGGREGGREGGEEEGGIQGGRGDGGTISRPDVAESNVIFVIA